MKNALDQAKKLRWTFLALGLLVTVFYACKNDEDTTPPLVKTALNARITSADSLYNASKEGTSVGSYLAGSKATFQTAISAAKTVVNDAASTQTSIDNATVNLGKAVEAFNAQKVAEIAPANLVAYFKFNGNANDASGKNNNGTLKTGTAPASAAPFKGWGGGVPTLTADRFGVANMAYKFQRGGHIEVPYNSALNPGKEITISLWAKLDSSRADNYLVALNRWNGYKFQLQSANKFFFTVKTNKPGIFDKDDETFTAEVGKWYQATVTYKSGEMNFYVAGTLVKSWTDVTGDPVAVKSSINLVIGADLPASLYQSNENPDADGNNFNGPWGGYFAGDLDDVRIYNVALSAAQVKSIYDAEKSQ